MNRTLKLSFSLKNTYRVNSILFSLKQLPLLGKIFPDALYQVRELKILANVISIIWEIVSAFLGKFLYFLTMVAGISALYQAAPERSFLHILFFLTAIGAFLNTYLFDPGRDKYYAIILMRMNARSYTLIHYGYAIFKVIVGFLPFTLIFGQSHGVPLWLCLLIPFFVAGAKMTAAAGSLLLYEKTGKTMNENGVGKFAWLLAGLLLAAAYGLPAVNILLPVPLTTALMALLILTGILSVRKILTFSHYHEMYHLILTQSLHQMDAAKQQTARNSQKLISPDKAITSRRKGFEFLNELFIRRHQKILWKASIKIAAVCLLVILGGLLAFALSPELKKPVNDVLMTCLPYFVFIMYAINRGTGFTQALFMNCDHSLLSYSFYKQPKFIVKLFQIRLREIVKVNLLPAAVIGAGLMMLLYASGGTDNPIHYAVLLISILSMSVFFSVHYLMIYYLLQPYNAGTELKSGTYRLAVTVTYLVCYFMMQVKLPTLLFGLMTIFFCIGYCIIACILVYKLAPKTFRIRN